MPLQPSLRLSQMLLVALMLVVTTTRSFCHCFTASSSQSLSLSPSPSTCKRTYQRSSLHSRRLPQLCLKSDGLTPEEREIKVGKATKAMTAFTNTYLKNTGTKLCEQKSIPAVVIKGLAEHKVDLGAPLCPCRFYEDKEKEVKDGYWNCPCVPMREEKVCHCMLFLTEDNAFAGEEKVRFVSCCFELSKNHLNAYVAYVVCIINCSCSILESHSKN